MDYIKHPTAVPFSQDAMNDPYGTDAKALSAGRELDAVIAEKVMGWEPVLHFGERGTGFWTIGGDVEDIRHDDDIPHYSSEIAAAWLVVEKLNERYHARVKSPFMPGELYFAGFTPHGATGWNGRPDFEASGETASLAICRAALAATAP